MTEKFPGWPLGRPKHRDRKTKGVRRAGGVINNYVNLGFDDELFERVAAKAAEQKVSFSELVRCYCEWGLEQEA